MATSKYAIIGMVVCTFMTATGQIFLKLGVDNFKFDLSNLSVIFNNHYLFIALFLYAVGLIVMTVSFKYGELSVLYPIISLSFVWVAGLSLFGLSEKLNIFKISAVILIVLGVSLIGKGSRGSQK